VIAERLAIKEAAEREARNAERGTEA
jgi:hypothetical protein